MSDYKREFSHALILAVGWLLLVIACYSPSVLGPDASKPAQADAIRAARTLDSLPANSVTPEARAALSEASRALQDCAANLRTQGIKLDEAVKANNQCKAEYDVQHAELERLKDQTGPIAWITDKLGRFGNAVFWFVMGGIFGGLVYRILLALIARVPV